LGHDLKVFDRAHDVHEPELDKLDVVFLDRLFDIIRGLAIENLGGVGHVPASMPWVFVVI
jgi:hypothetical protein